MAESTRPRDNGPVDPAVEAYIERIPPKNRPLFDRLHDLVMRAHPDAAVVLSYEIPTYKVGDRKIFLGAWSHGVSIYGWGSGGDAGFLERHPQLRTGKGTIKLRAADAAAISDQEFSDLISAALAG